MAIRAHGHECQITQLGASGDDVYHLLANVAERNARLRETADEFDATAYGSGLSAYTYSNGLKSWELSFEGLFPASGRKAGSDGGNVTFASGYTTYVRSWDMRLEAAVKEGTVYTGAAVSWRHFEPGLVRASGSYECIADKSAAVSAVTASGAAAASATFKLTEEGGTDNELTCSIRTTAREIVGDLGDFVIVRYDYTVNGAVTVVGSTNFLPSGAVGIPDWDANADGTADVQGVFQIASGRTFTGNVFWKSIGLNVPIGGLITLAVDLQGTGALTLA